MKITNAQLYYLVDSINRHSKNEYALDFAYGKCRLVRKSKHGGIVEMTAYGSKSETYMAMNAIYAWVLEELAGELFG